MIKRNGGNNSWMGCGVLTAIMVEVWFDGGIVGDGGVLMIVEWR